MIDTAKYGELRSQTVPRVFLDRVNAVPNQVAYRAKKRGIYKERTWSQFCDAVACCAKGFSQQGLREGDTLALMGDPCEEYVICELAAQSLGAITCGIHPTSSQDEMEYMVENCKASFFIAGNQEYLDRAMPLLDKIPCAKHMVVIDTKGMFGYEHPALTSYERLLAAGADDLAAARSAFEAMAGRVKPADGLSIVYTSGTTGKSKGVLVSHGKHLAAVQALIDHYPALTQGTHRTVVYLPLSGLIGKIVAVTLPLLAPVVPHYGEDVEEPGQTFFEVAPTLLFTVPGYLKRLASAILVDMENSSPLKRLAYTVALSVGRQHLYNVWDKRAELLTKVVYLLCYYTVFRPILNKMGFAKLKMVISTGSHLPGKLMTLWQIYGLNLSESYGLAETGAGIVAAQESVFPRPGDVGKPLTCLEVMLSDAGEVLVRGEELSECYWNNQEPGDTFRDVNGWIRTGDAGEWTPEGTLRIRDRFCDACGDARSRSISYTAVEGSLKASPYISEAVVLGKDRAYLTVLIAIDFDAVSDWANRNGVPFTGFANLIQQPEVVAHVGREIERINSELKADEQVQAFRIIPGELASFGDEALVTPTRKIRRQAVERKFASLIASMYEGT